MSKRWSLVTIVILVIIVALLSNAYNVVQEKNTTLEQKLEAAENANRGLREDMDKLIRYHECIAKIFIAPPDGPKVLEGNTNDPAVALENCRIQAEGVSLTNQPDFNPPDSELEANPNPTRQSTPPGTQTSPSNTPPETTPPEDPTPESPSDSIIDMITDGTCSLPIIGRLCN